MKYWFKRKWRQINRVIDYLPIIWKGYDWDYKYAVELFQHQLKRTADEIELRGHGENVDNTVNRIRTAVELLEKVYDEDYLYEYATMMEDKYGPYETRWEPIDDLVDGQHWDAVEVYEEEYTKEELLLMKEERHQAQLDSQEKQKRAHRIVWRYIEHNILNWWD